MDSSSASVKAAWTVELDAIKEEITDIYLRPGGAYNLFYIEWTTPTPNGRSRCNPRPMCFYNETPRLQELYARAVTLVSSSGTYDDLIDILEWLQENCPEQGRGLYFSNNILCNRLLASEHRTKCAYAYIASLIKDAQKDRGDVRFGHDVIADIDNGDVEVIHTKLVKRIPELSCAALPLLAAVRVVIYPTRHGREALNAAAIAESPWLAFARTIVPSAAGKTADELVREIITEEFRQKGEEAWMRRRAVVLARDVALAQ